MGRQHQEMDRPGIRQVLDGSREQGRMEETGCEIICDTLATPAVKVKNSLCVLIERLVNSECNISGLFET